MNPEPDWEALNQLNFMLAPRISAPLNEALNALTLADMPESNTDPKVWNEKARIVVGNLLHLYQAWSALIQFKNGIRLPPTAIRPFPVQSLLDWLTIQLGLIPPARAKRNFYLTGNQPSIQEALLLLYTVSATQGTEVHLVVDPTVSGSWFRIRFARNRPMATSIDAMLEGFGSDWRSQDAAFELNMARDFVRLNGSDININWDEKQSLGEFSFFVQRDRTQRTETPAEAASPDADHARIVSNITRSLMSSQRPTLRSQRTGSEDMTPIDAVSDAMSKMLAGMVAESGDTPVPLEQPQDASSSPAEGSDARAIVNDPDATRPLHNTPLVHTPVPAEGEDSIAAERAESKDFKSEPSASIIDMNATPLVTFASPPPAAPEPTTSEDDEKPPKTGPRIVSVEMPEPETPAQLKPKKSSVADSEEEETPS